MTAKQTVEKSNEKNHTPAITSSEIPTLNVALDKIVPDFDFNSRKLVSVDETGRTAAEIKAAGADPKGKWTKTYKGVKDMMASFKVEGQVQPIKLRPIVGDGGKYTIVMGFTRFLAAKELGWPTIRAQIESLDDKTAGKQNMVENITRDALTPYETAMGAKRLRDTYEISGAELARSAGKSKSYFNNLMRVLDRVHPDLLKHWEDGHVLAHTDNMVKLAALGGEEATDKERHKLQIAFWDELEGGGDDEEEGTGEKESNGANARAVKRPSTAKLKEALSAIKKSDLDKDEKDLASKCIRFALGTLKTIPGVYDPDAADNDDE